ncbi:suppressor of fused domain protein [Streptomyces yaanensis]|uniref:Suppressor of fused domain protein n=1 Tax=Streptomyces yaanensis TaxID=1142239 RepID=A0ABV7SHY4_9ACTN|nr:suppressor of fused domain protein [Streptomyces sp. CGMCC 4.7035]WNB97418.1 suppressor of fused domain protein [Streptomyces sp. CGMCC 4.7035]
MAVLIEHLESRLGRLLGAWEPSEQSPEGTPRVGYFTGGVLAGIQCYATIGLFKTHLTSRVSDRPQHLELLGCGRPVPGDETGPLPGVLEWVAERLVVSGEAVLRGDVIPLPMPLLPGGTMTALYAALPVCFDDDFASVVLENGVETAMVWLVPIGESEAAFVRVKGWDAFEEELVRQDPDLLDLNRAEIAL